MIKANIAGYYQYGTFNGPSGGSGYAFQNYMSSATCVVRVHNCDFAADGFFAVVIQDTQYGDVKTVFSVTNGHITPVSGDLGWAVSVVDGHEVATRGVTYGMGSAETELGYPRLPWPYVAPEVRPEVNKVIPVICYPVTSGDASDAPNVVMRKGVVDGDESIWFDYVEEDNMTVTTGTTSGGTVTIEPAPGQALPALGAKLIINGRAVVVSGFSPESPPLPAPPVTPTAFTCYYPVALPAGGVQVKGTTPGADDTLAETYSKAPLMIGQDAYGYDITWGTCGDWLADSGGGGRNGIAGGWEEGEIDAVGGSQVNIYIYGPATARLNSSLTGHGEANRGKTNAIGGGKYSGTKSQRDTGKGPLPEPAPGGGNGRTGGGYVNIPGFNGGAYVPPETAWLQMTPSILDFGEVCMGSSASQTAIIENIGTGPAVIPQLSPSAVPNFSLTGELAIDEGVPVVISGGITVEAKKSITIQLFFNPTEEIAYDYLQTIVDANDDNALQIVAAGIGIDCEIVIPPVRTIRIDGDVFGEPGVNFQEQTINTTETKTFKITSTGTYPVTISSISRNFGDDVFSVVDKAFDLAPDKSYDVPIEFLPLLAQAYDATIRVATNATNVDPDGSTYVAAVGVGIPVEVTITRILRVNGPLDFGGVFIGDSKDLAVTLSSIGTGALFVTMVSVPKPFYLLTNDTRFNVVTNPNGSTSLIVKDIYSTIEPSETTAPITVRYVPEVSGETPSELAFTVEVTEGPVTHPITAIGVYDLPPDPGGDPGGGTPDPDPGSDPPSPSNPALDGIGNTCVRKDCEIHYLYKRP